MSKLTDFLESLTDSELAIFIAYRYDGFLNSSQIKIKQEIRRRELDQDQLVSLYKKGLPIPDEQGYYCPRCHSRKFIVAQEKQIRENWYTTYEVLVKSNRCRLCGYNPRKHKSKNLIHAIKTLFATGSKVDFSSPPESIYRNWIS